MDLSQYSDADLRAIAGGTSAIGAVSQAILGQESGGNPNAPTSIDGAVGMGQIMPSTFAMYAKPGENVSNPNDNLAVHNRILQDYSTRYAGDPSRMAVAYFSGPGNVAPPDSKTPWKKDVADGNGKSVSSYVSDVLGRVGGSIVPEAQAADLSSLSDDQLKAIAGADAAPSGLGAPKAAIAGKQQPSAQDNAMAAMSGQGPGIPLLPYTEGLPARLTALGANYISQIPGLKEAGSALAAIPALFDKEDGSYGKEYGRLQAAQKTMREAGRNIDPGPTMLADAAGLIEGMGLAGGAFGNIAPKSATAIAAYAKAHPYLANVAMGAPVGALYGLADGEDTGSRLSGAAAGGALGALSAIPLTFAANNVIAPLVGKLAEGAGGAISRVSNLFSKEPIAEFAAAPIDSGPAKARAQEILAQAMQDEGISGQSIATRLGLAKKTGLPVTALDVAVKDIGGVTQSGRNLMGLADAAANMPGPGATMAGKVASRGQTQIQRVGNALDEAISSKNLYKVTDEALAAIEKNAPPAYAKAFAEKPVTSDKIQALLQEPKIQSGIKRGVEIQRIEAAAEGRVFDPNDYGLVSVNPGVEDTLQMAAVPNMRLLDAGKKGLDAMIEEAKNPLTGKMTEMGRALSKLKSSYVGELDSLNPSYAAARKTYGDQASRLNALNMGRDFNRMDAEEISRFMADKTKADAEKASFAVGVRRALQDRMDKMRDGGNAVGRLWNQDLRNKLRPLFPTNSSFNKFTQNMQLEQRMAMTNQTLTRGSQTAPRQAYMEEINQKPSDIAGKAIKAMVNPKGAAIDATINTMSSRLAKQVKSLNKETAAEIMRFLTSDDPALWSAFDKTVKASNGNPKQVYRTAKMMFGKSVKMPFLGGAASTKTKQITDK